MEIDNLFVNIALSGQSYYFLAMEASYNNSFIELTNLLRFNVNHAHIAIFGTPFRGANTIPYNRLFVVAHDSPVNGSWFRNRSTIPHQTVDLLPGHIYLLPGDLDLQFNFESGLKVCGYHFSLEIFPGFDLFAGEQHCMGSNDFADLVRYICDYAGEVQSIGTMAAVRGAILMLAASFCERTSDDIRQIIAVGDEFRPLVSYLETEGTAQTDITDLADRMGMGRDQLRKRFSRRTGVPLKTYMSTCLTRKASELLLLTDKRVYEVAAALEFSSEYYFSRFFKKRTGMSPSQYRRNVLLSG